jgi:hypothetical protein
MVVVAVVVEGIHMKDLMYNGNRVLHKVQCSGMDNTLYWEVDNGVVTVKRREFGNIYIVDKVKEPVFKGIHEEFEIYSMNYKCSKYKRRYNVSMDSKSDNGERKAIAEFKRNISRETIISCDLVECSDKGKRCALCENRLSCMYGYKYNG